ncbi:hypothetical protein K438DRAFT_2024283 [Mycena galopus ATCC 62051]|nr:hypothetical protein K438DRAFT_2024283 [Mycena galopus ATCC 62051]
MYPVLTLPFDVISQIFVYCLPPEDDALPWRTEAPLLLAGICRDWRHIALITSELWNTIHLRLRPQLSISKVDPLLKFWLPRAGGLPLSMSLVYKCAAGTDPIPLKSIRALGKLLAEYALHWTSIELALSLETLVQLRAPDRDFASLKKLVLNCQSWGSEQRLAHVFRNASRIEELHMISNAPTKLVLPWEQLMTLKLDNSTPAECLQTLALVPNLVNFTGVLWTEGAARPIPPLSQLESLTFILSHTRGPELLDSLTLPALLHLDLDLQGLPEIARVASLGARSPCFIRRLSVGLGPNWTADHFMQLFLALDFLEVLELKKAGRSLNTGLGLLKIHPHLLPNLRSLSVQRTLSELEDVELLADLLESRWNIPAGVSLPVQLKSFRLDSPLSEAPDTFSDALLRLARLRAEGMDIQIRSSFRLWFH